MITKISLSVKEGSMPAKKVAAAILKKLVEEKEEAVILTFVLTEYNREQMSEKTIAIERIANDMLIKEGGYFNELLAGQKKVLITSLPVVKKKAPETTDVVKGYEDRIRVHEIKFRLADAYTPRTTPGRVDLSVKEDSKSAGAVASRILRTLLVDEKDCVLNFVVSAKNNLKMCEKVLSVERIMKRMLKDSGNIIHNSLPVKVKYEVECYAPIMVREKIKLTEGEESPVDNITVHEILFVAK